MNRLLRNLVLASPVAIAITVGAASLPSQAETLESVFEKS